MPDVLIASDASWVQDEVRSVVAGRDVTLRQAHSGVDVLELVCEQAPDLAIIDQQMGNMGGFATALHLHMEESSGRLPHVPVLLLLDRRADVFLARRSEVEGWLVKPLDPIRLRRAVRAVLGGGTYFDDSYLPTVAATGVTLQDDETRPVPAAD